MDKDIATRVASAVVMMAGAFALIWLGSLTTVLLTGLVVFLMAREWTFLTLQGEGRAVADAALLAAPVFVVLLGFWAGLRLEGALLPSALVLLALALLVPVLRRGRGLGRPGMFWMAGIVYLGLPSLAFLGLRLHADGGWFVFWVFAVVIATDTFAYFVGKALKGPKLAPSISPGKTWAGFWGGSAAAGLVGAAAAGSIDLGVSLAGLLGVAVAVSAQIGDLFESVMKRRAGVKHSSDLIPGHGGILDRIDGYLFAIPVFVLFLTALGLP